MHRRKLVTQRQAHHVVRLVARAPVVADDVAQPVRESTAEVTGSWTWKRVLLTSPLRAGILGL